MPRGAQAKPRKTAFGRWLKTAREYRGWSITDLAVAAKLTHPRISQIENGDDAPPIKTVRKLVEALYTGDPDDTESYQKFELSALQAVAQNTGTPDSDDWLEDAAREAGFDNLSDVPEDERDRIRRAGAAVVGSLIADQLRSRSR